MKKKLMDFIPEVDINSDEGIDEIDEIENGELYPGEFEQRYDDTMDEDLNSDKMDGGYMNKPVIDARDKSSMHPDIMITQEFKINKDRASNVNYDQFNTELHKKELKDRFNAMTGDERDILITRFNTKELYLELGRRLDKQKAFIDSLGTLVDDYRKDE